MSFTLSPLFFIRFKAYFVTEILQLITYMVFSEIGQPWTQSQLWTISQFGTIHDDMMITITLAVNHTLLLSGCLLHISSSGFKLEGIFAPPRSLNNSATRVQDPLVHYETSSLFTLKKNNPPNQMKST